MSEQLYQKQLSLLLDNKLDIDSFPELKQHLQECVNCAKTYEIFVQIEQEFQELDYPFTIPADFSDKIMKRIPKRRLFLGKIATILFAFFCGAMAGFVFLPKETIYVVKNNDFPKQHIGNVSTLIEHIAAHQKKQEWQKAKFLLEILKYRSEDNEILAMTSFYLAQIYKKEKQFKKAVEGIKEFCTFVEISDYETPHIGKNLEDVLLLAQELQMNVTDSRHKHLLEEQIKRLKKLLSQKYF